VRGIEPPVLAGQGQGATIRCQAAKASIPVDVRADGISRYPEEVEAAAYFCVLEALQNVAKYSSGAGATVRLFESDGSLVFEVRDQGPGFDPSSRGRGSGLQGMADRLSALGGELDVEAGFGEGTTVQGRRPT